MHYSLPVVDFRGETISVTIPANSRSFRIRIFFTINDDNIDEDDQSFAVVAEILDIPENTACFQTAIGVTNCHGQQGATELKIIDDDCKFFSLWFFYFALHCSLTFLLTEQPKHLVFKKQ